MPRKPQRLLKQSPLASPSETRRQRDAALSAMRSAKFGTMLAKLHGADRITTQQFIAGKRWSEVVDDYSRACRSPGSAQPEAR